MSENSHFKDVYEQQLRNFYDSQRGKLKKPWTNKRILEVISHLISAKRCIDSGIRRTSMQYYWCTKFELMNISDEDYLIIKKKSPDDPTIRVVPTEQYFDILLEIHKETGHGGRDKMLCSIKNVLYVQKKAVEIFIALCPVCEKKRSMPKKVMAKSIISKDFNNRGQVGLIDFQSAPNGDYKWLLNYQDLATKFLQLRPLRTNQASEVALELMKIFMAFGAPLILQSDNGGEFTAKIVEEIMKMWPAWKVLHGSPRDPQTQGSMEQSNQDVENILRTWMCDNNSTSWSVGCNFVQYEKNASYHRIIGMSPYLALFGCNPKFGLQSSNIPENLKSINTEQQLEIDVNKNIDNDDTKLQNVNDSLENSVQDEAISTNSTNCKIPTPHSSIIQNNYISDTNVTNTNKENNTLGNLIWDSSRTVKLSSNSVSNTLNDTNDVIRVVETNKNVEDNNDNISIIYFQCSVCGDDTSGVHKCYSCLKPVHAICELSDGTESSVSKILCLLCKRELDFRNEREKAYQRMKRAAKRMVYETAKKLPRLNVGDSIFVNVPKVDCGPLETKIDEKTVDIPITMDVKLEREELDIKDETEGNSLLKVYDTNLSIRNCVANNEIKVEVKNEVEDCVVQESSTIISEQGTFECEFSAVDQAVKFLPDVEALTGEVSSDAEYPQVSRNKPGKIILSEQKHKAYDLFLKHKNQKQSKSRSVKYTALEIGISERSVWNIVSEMEKHGRLTSPQKTRKCRNFFDKLNEDQKATVRRLMHTFFEKNEPPTINDVVQAVQKDGTLPPMGRTSVWILLKKLGFTCDKKGGKYHLLPGQGID